MDNPKSPENRSAPEFTWHMDDDDWVPDTDPEYWRRTRIMAQTMALVDAGYSIREAERLLKTLFNLYLS